MNDIQQLIDRYLAEGLSSDELARLSRAVHRDDAPAEWLVIREMIDTLTEGEDDYDLILAAREAAVSAKPAVQHSVTHIKRFAFFRELAAASVFVVAAIGAALYFTHEPEPQISEARGGSQVVSDSPAVSSMAFLTDSSVASTASEPEVAPAPVESEPKSKPSVPRQVTERSHPARQRAIAATQKPAAPKGVASPQQSETPSTKAPTEVPERRIYSCNLLDQIPESYEAPTLPTDGY